MIGYAVFRVRKGSAELSETDAHAEVFADRDQAERRKEEMEQSFGNQDGVEVVVRDAVLSLF